MRLVYLSPVPWRSFAQRPHKFVQWFHERTGESVLWVDPYPTRLPRLSDFKFIKASPADGSLDSLPAWLTVIKPEVLPIEPLPGAVWINRFRWRNTIQSVASFLNKSTALMVIGKPSAFAIEILTRFNFSLTIYDAMDDFPAFYSGISRLALTFREQLVAKHVDLVLASSTPLQKKWSSCVDNVRLVRNGLDIGLLPADNNYNSRLEKDNKVFGYVGTIASWFDWDWLFALAEVKPMDEIRLIGPVFNRTMKKLPGNVKLHPACDHKSALKAMMEFDVGLIPFKCMDLTESVDPIKFYEYRTLGLPVLTTNFGEMRYRSYEDGVFISYGLTDVASVAEKASNHFCSPVDIQKFARNNSWEVRFDDSGLLR